LPPTEKLTTKDNAGDRVGKGYVIHAGSVVLPLGEGTLALPFAAL